MNAVKIALAVLSGLVISPILALGISVFAFFEAMYLFWKGFITEAVSGKEPNKEVQEELDIWERHIKRQKDTTKSSTQIGCEESSPE
jgi:cytochrome b subunit of formate dehydrogenase